MMYPTDQDIEDYIDGILSASEMQKFEDAMANDKSLEERIELRRKKLMSMKDLIARENNLSNFSQLGGTLLDAKSEEEYLAEAQQIFDEDGLVPNIPVETNPERGIRLEPVSFQKKTTNSKVLPFFKKYGWIAAVILLLIVGRPYILSFWPSEKETILEKDLLAAANNPKYFPPDANKPLPVPKNRGSNDILSIIEKAESQMSSNSPNYIEITKLWNDVLKNSNPPRAKFNYGLSLLLAGNYKEAIQEFEVIIQNPNYLEDDHARVNIIRAYLWLGDSSKVSETLCYYLKENFRHNRKGMETLKNDLKIPCD